MMKEPDTQVPATILMIEDDPKFVRLVEKILDAEKYRLIHAPTALTGLHLAETNDIDLVLLDLDLPDLDGKVVATTLRARSGMRDVPVVAVTAQNDASTRRLVMAFGCNGFIPKPIDTRMFSEQVQSFLSSSES